jgi:predicted ATPase
MTAISNEAERDIFKAGSTWLRADFHLHTRVDGEFFYNGKDNDFINAYVEGLKQAEIRLGVLTNHNKFNLDEFKALSKAARKEEICLLPGVELSINEGSNGIHILIIFNPEQWIKQGSDLINPFISSMFTGKTKDEYERENANSDKNLLQTIEELDKRNLDYFFIFAHVEQGKGLWIEMGGSKLSAFQEERYAALRRRCLGFQKVRTHDVPERSCRLKVQTWLGDWYPAELEGSDCKSIEQIGKGEKKTYLKLGSFTFDAIKYALLDYKNRVKDSIPDIQHSYIKKITVLDGAGALSSESIDFSAALNTLIGIRGSGKSSLIEVLRYGLGLAAGAGDEGYKNNLINKALGSAGKFILTLVNCHGQEYEIHYIKDQTPDIYLNGIKQSGISIKDTIIRNPIYFGQKDLSGSGENYYGKNSLVEKFLEKELQDIRLKIYNKSEEIKISLEKLSKKSQAKDTLNDQNDIIKNIEHRLEIYKKYKLEDGLNESLELDKDLDLLKRGQDLIRRFIDQLNQLLSDYDDDLDEYLNYKSKYNEDLTSDFISKFQKFKDVLIALGVSSKKSEELEQGFLNLSNSLAQRKNAQKESFAELERSLASEIKNTEIKNITVEEFKKLTEGLLKAQNLKDLLEKEVKKEEGVSGAFRTALSELEELWQEEYKLADNKLKELCKGTEAISIESSFQRDKGAFLDFIKNTFKGSGIRDATYEKIAERFKNFIEIYKALNENFEQEKIYFGSNPEDFRKLFNEKIISILTYQTPNEYLINYHGKNLLHHSLGQRASALIIFILTRGGHDLIMIDQPEDDLDNQTIYEDVIKLVREIKPKVQFILATHNPNIPVLGDAELVQVCSFLDEKITIMSGSIDKPEIQKQIIDIMEGGKEAFDRRKEIYRKWNP